MFIYKVTAKAEKKNSPPVPKKKERKRSVANQIVQIFDFDEAKLHRSDWFPSIEKKLMSFVFDNGV